MALVSESVKRKVTVLEYVISEQGFEENIWTQNQRYPKDGKKFTYLQSSIIIHILIGKLLRRYNQGR
jgi:hypothetical protein